MTTGKRVEKIICSRLKKYKKDFLLPTPDEDRILITDVWLRPEEAAFYVGIQLHFYVPGPMASQGIGQEVRRKKRIECREGGVILKKFTPKQIWHSPERHIVDALMGAVGSRAKDPNGLLIKDLHGDIHLPGGEIIIKAAHS